MKETSMLVAEFVEIDKVKIPVEGLGVTEIASCEISSTLNEVTCAHIVVSLQPSTEIIAA